MGKRARRGSLEEHKHLRWYLGMATEPPRAARTTGASRGVTENGLTWPSKSARRRARYARLAIKHAASPLAQMTAPALTVKTAMTQGGGMAPRRETCLGGTCSADRLPEPTPIPVMKDIVVNGGAAGWYVTREKWDETMDTLCTNLEAVHMRKQKEFVDQLMVEVNQRINGLLAKIEQLEREKVEEKWACTVIQEEKEEKEEHEEEVVCEDAAAMDMEFLAEGFGDEECDHERASSTDSGSTDPPWDSSFGTEDIIALECTCKYWSLRARFLDTGWQKGSA